MTWLALDIGGANLKAATAHGWARSLPFALWREPHQLLAALTSLINDASSADGIAVTMTGELCDCFRTKTEGVLHILAAAEKLAAGRDLLVYLVDGRFASLAEARDSPQLAAASNWRALAEFACRFAIGDRGVLIDIGSTTTDIIPITGGKIAARGTTDTERLLARELVYTGVGRTPVCAMATELPLRNSLCPVAAEVFSTTADAYVLLNEIVEDVTANWTADGRPLTRESASQRLARQICSDAADLTRDELDQMASAVRSAQLKQLTKSIVAATGSTPLQFAITSGAGEFVAQSALQQLAFTGRHISLADVAGSETSRSGPAFAIAVLAEERAAACKSGIGCQPKERAGAPKSA